MAHLREQYLYWVDLGNTKGNSQFATIFQHIWKQRRKRLGTTATFITSGEEGMTSPAEAMRELAAQAIESDKFDPTVRMDFDKHKGLPDWFNAQRAAYIRSIPLPDDPRDAEIAALKRQMALLIWAWRTDTQWSGTEPKIVRDAVALIGDDQARTTLTQSGEAS